MRGMLLCRGLILVSLSAVLAALPSAYAEEPAREKQVGALRFDKLEHDFGSVGQNQELAAVFTYTKRPLRCMAIGSGQRSTSVTAKGGAGSLGFSFLSCLRDRQQRREVPQGQGQLEGRPSRGHRVLEELPRPR